MSAGRCCRASRRTGFPERRRKSWKANVSGYLLNTAKGSIQAKQILLATGACQHGGPGWYRRRIVPVGSFVIVTEVLPQTLIDQLLPQHRAYVTSRMIGNYFRLTPDNRLLFGGRARFAMSNATSDAKSGKVLRAAMVQMFPQLASAKVDYCWGGLVDMTSDRLPRAGEHEGVFYPWATAATAYRCPSTWAVMADVMDGNPQANPWRELDWPAVPDISAPRGSCRWWARGIDFRMRGIRFLLNRRCVRFKDARVNREQLMHSLNRQVELIWLTTKTIPH